MSKFIDAIRAQMLGDRRARIPNLTVTQIIDDPPSIYYRADQKYSCEVLWRVVGFCQPQELAALQENAIRELKEDIYGDFRSQLIRLERAVYENDRDAILSNIRDIRKEIFG